MAVSTGMSFLISTLLALSLFSVMQLNSKWLTSSSVLVIGTGFLGSVLFTLSLTVSFIVYKFSKYLYNQSITHLTCLQ
ncbi:protein KRTCAP2 homolog [Acyrthosiphon pisum]|uniref:Dolichyl-diphosphooligosaccharide--protein glycosyltransferase subunit KCP2 n=1 Tax=Acyrthosiphon pisum TaxID=7029 RepID=A0A8R2A444_ACYPI|nr:protein KRTCAP2 homolog [Acyrthosiphon pisum]|eukprot:XP_003240997.1 PREDICTED: protein KRTCAP2 homolog [Acyrthosiphon pisum]